VSGGVWGGIGRPRHPWDAMPKPLPNELSEMVTFCSKDGLGYASL